MDIKDLQNLLSQPYKQDNWKEIVQFVFPNVSILATPTEFPITNDKIVRFSQIGSVKLNDGKNLALFELMLDEKVSLQRNRVELNNEISKYIDQEQIHGVLSVFEQGGDDYRFTFSARSTEFDEEESDFRTVKTDTKRFTYVLGKNESCRTPAKRFHELSENKAEADILAIQKAFSVEKLSKEFFDSYKKQFELFWKYIASNKEYRKLFLEDDKEKQIRDFTKKLLGRIVFLHFLQKKGWMGCDYLPDVWENGDKQFMQNLYKDFANKEEFHSQCLSPLFFDTLNNGKRDNFLFNCVGLEGELNNSKIPYLNGGLFDTDAEISKQIDFEVKDFEKLFEFFGQYNFTIDENDPNDHEVGIDPEMLGHIFENLLEDNKDKGAFYTPKVIVQYMCQESLIEYLATKLNAEENTEYKPAIETLVRERLAQQVNEFDLIEPIARALYEVKICDPAIGSGAFPMGILNEIYQVVEELFALQPDAVAEVWKIDNNEWQPHLVKKNIIQHSIYGVDLESGAVDIARLRFWLALVVDEVEPLPLPNLDYKIMQGNSLLESFEGVDLSEISNEAAYETQYKTIQRDIFSGEAEKEVQVSLVYEDMQTLMDEYFNSSDPDEKKALHKRIDNQVINHIHFKFNEHKKLLQKQIKKNEKIIRNNQAAAKTAEQKIKIGESSKAAKELKKHKTDFEKQSQKEIKLAKLSPSNDKPFFLWQLFFKEVFDKGGFDIVIANPPYVEFKNLDKEFKNSIEPFYKSLKGKYDLYIAFIELYNNLLKKEGISVSIHPTRFMQRDYGKLIRKILNESISLISILDFVDKKVFENALAYTGVFITKNTKKTTQNFLYGKAKSNKIIKNIEELRFTNNSAIFDFIDIKTDLLSENLWIFQNEFISKLFNKIRSFSKPLYDIVDGIYQGIATGKDSVFLLTENEINENEIERTLLKPFLKGKDIAPFSVNFKNKYLIYPYDKEGSVLDEEILKINNPKLYNHLIKNKDELSGRGYFEKSTKLWFELWNQRNPKRFEQLKIVTLDNAKTNSFAIDINNNFGATTVYNIIKEDGDEYFYAELLLILNSSLLCYYHSMNTIPQAGGYLRYQAIFIKNLPIKFGLSEKTLTEFIKSDYKIPNKTFFENYNSEVFKLYEIDKNEVEFIQSKIN